MDIDLAPRKYHRVEQEDRMSRGTQPAFRCYTWQALVLLSSSCRVTVSLRLATQTPPRLPMSLKGHRPGQFTDFQLTGPTGIFTGFTPEFVSRAWDLSQNDVAKLVHNQSSTGIVKLKDGQKMPELSNKDRDGLVVNCYKVPLDVDTEGGSCVEMLNSNNLSIVELVGLGVDLVRLYGGAMCSPGFSCDSAYQARILVTYVVKGSGRVQVVGIDGKRVLETKVLGGQLFIVPRFFVVSKIADPEGMEWFSIIITTPNPVFSHLAGRTSVWKAISPQVLEASFGTTSELEQLFRSKRTLTLSSSLLSELKIIDRGYSCIWHVICMNISSHYLLDLYKQRREKG
ncbi:11S globulin seed storage protein 2-like protein [Carex littledalei]|uniref:11S globulin seed storage protein 2-like protein n=1 Tax=Carex littledalei TaxID=544730 RepID=A0A833VL65_9POAL|nr:11S globulin seed storage protein 2-like protein [Carex littledalei]